MTALAEYLLKANLCLVGFYALYYLLLRRHTFFSLNRAYLLMAMVASFALPFIPVPEPVVETVALPIISLPVTTISVEPTGPTTEDVLLVVYGVVALVFCSLLLISLWRLMQLIRSGEAIAQLNHTLVVLHDDRVAPFSFFRYLVINQTDLDTHAEPIIQHELAHIRQWHSIDVLLAELVKVVCWPNPVAWLYKRSLQQVHEYLADQQAADKAQYARFLFDYALEGSTSPVANSFFTPALLAQRIRMLYQARNTGRALWKYTLVVPLLAILVGLTAARERIAETLESHPGKKITVTGQVVDDANEPVQAMVLLTDDVRAVETNASGHFQFTNVSASAKLTVSSVGFETQSVIIQNDKPLTVRLKTAQKVLDEVVVTGYSDEPKRKPVSDELFTVVEQNPEFPGGMVALGQYLSRTLRYPAEARQQHTSGVVFVQFVVGTDGAIQSPRILKGIGSGCDEEAIRVVSQMPNWKPGKQSGHPVNVVFNLPIQFALEGNKSTSLLPGEKPLVFIDGVEQDRNFDLNTIKPNDIQSINVLKGGTAETYGEKGKNGVLLITTKPKKP